jgi:hypothetical protein
VNVSTTKFKSLVNNFLVLHYINWATPIESTDRPIIVRWIAATGALLLAVRIHGFPVASNDVILL